MDPLSLRHRLDTAVLFASECITTLHVGTDTVSNQTSESAREHVAELISAILISFDQNSIPFVTYEADFRGIQGELAYLLTILCQRREQSIRRLRLFLEDDKSWEDDKIDMGTAFSVLKSIHAWATKQSTEASLET